VRRYYTKAQMTDSYRALYEKLAAAPDVPRGSRSAATGGCPVHHGAPASPHAAQAGETR
jgi:polysaccharide biosynthesis protein PelF